MPSWSKMAMALIDLNKDDIFSKSTNLFADQSRMRPRVWGCTAPHTSALHRMDPISGPQSLAPPRLKNCVCATAFFGNFHWCVGAGKVKKSGKQRKKKLSTAEKARSVLAFFPRTPHIMRQYLNASRRLVGHAPLAAVCAIPLLCICVVHIKK